MHIFIIMCLILSTFAQVAKSGNRYNGILINGEHGTQLYDPFNTPHSIGNLSLRLQSGQDARGGSAIVVDHTAYFGGGIGGKNDF
jgi:hypothetical protein